MGSNALWAWVVPQDGSYTAIARINYTLGTPEGSAATLLCGLKEEGIPSYVDSASDLLNLDHTDIQFLTNVKKGSFTLVAPIESIAAGVAIQVECTSNTDVSGSAHVSSVSLELIPFNQFHQLTEL